MQEGEVIALLGVCAAAMVILFPIVRALADRIRPRPIDAGAMREELQVLREDLLAEIQQARREIGDLGERVDFTERLLAKKNDR
jgi:hypothetical protein